MLPLNRPCSSVWSPPNFNFLICALSCVFTSRSRLSCDRKIDLFSSGEPLGTADGVGLEISVAYTGSACPNAALAEAASTNKHIERPIFICARNETHPRLRANRYATDVTSRAFLSSLNPRNTGCRNFLSRVHSANLICATSSGFTQFIFRIIDGVIPCTHFPLCFDGRSTKGQSSRFSFRNSLCKIDNVFSVNPVTTLPAKLNFPFS